MNEPQNELPVAYVPSAVHQFVQQQEAPPIGQPVGVLVLVVFSALFVWQLFGQSPFLGSLMMAPFIIEGVGIVQQRPWGWKLCVTCTHSRCSHLR